MRVAEGNVGDGDLMTDLRSGFGNVEGVVSEGGAADLAQGLVLDDEAAGNPEAIADVLEGHALARLGSLAVVNVQSGDCIASMLANSERGADSGVHSTAEHNDGVDSPDLILDFRHT